MAALTYRCVGGDMDGELLTIPDSRDRWLIPVPVATHALLDRDDPFDLATRATEWTVQRWRRDWHLIGDDHEYLTPPGYQLARAEMQVGVDMLLWEGWNVLAMIGVELERFLPGTIMGPPLLWCESVNRNTMMATVRMTAPVVT